MLAVTLGTAGVSPPAVAEAGPSVPRDVGGLDRPDAAPDLDARPGRVAPGHRQLDLVEALGADVRWTRFGTAASLVPRSGAFTSHGAGGPVAIARGFLHDNRALFRMSAGAVRRLELVRAGPLANLTHADADEVPQVVLLRERFGALPAGAGGLIALGIVGDDITYVSSSALGSAAPPPPAQLTPTQAWLRAADALGRPVAANAVGPIDRSEDRRGWTTFTVAGFTQVQQARLVAVGLPGHGVRPAYEVNVVDVQDGAALAHTSFVDAASGTLLLRHNRVDHLLGTYDHRRPRASADRTPCEPGCGVRLAGTLQSPVWDAMLPPWLSTITTPDEPGVPVSEEISTENAESNNARTSPAWTSPLARTADAQSADDTESPAGTESPADAGGPARWSDAWRRSGCDISRLHPGGNDVRVAVAGVFDLHNGLHDWAYRLGFTEVNGNLQQDNAGRGGLDR
ncbi:MAG: M36 family metallopeptidase, partial [Actinopolymorphaceae bacterium]